MRDIQQVLARWGAWAANNHENVYWRPIAAGFSELVPSKIKSREQCTDDDGLIISSCMASLNKKNPDAHYLLFDYYIFGKTLMIYITSRPQLPLWLLGLFAIDSY